MAIVLTHWWHVHYWLMALRWRVPLRRCDNLINHSHIKSGLWLMCFARHINIAQDIRSRYMCDTTIYNVAKIWMGYMVIVEADFIKYASIVSAFICWTHPIIMCLYCKTNPDCQSRPTVYVTLSGNLTLKLLRVMVIKVSNNIPGKYIFLYVWKF